MRKSGICFLLVLFLLSFAGSNAVMGITIGPIIQIQSVPVAPSTLASTAKTTTTVTLNNETGFKVERKTGAGNYAQVGTVTAGVTTYTSTGMAAGTSYSFKVRAYNLAGNSGYSNEIAVTTTTKVLIPDSQLTPLLPLLLTPAAPSNLAITELLSNSIKLTWKDNSANENGFIITRFSGSFPIFNKEIKVGANVTSYQDTGLSSLTKYYYAVKAYNAIGNSSDSSRVSGTTVMMIKPELVLPELVLPKLVLPEFGDIFEIIPIIVPATPSGLTATASSTEISLAWTDVSSEIGYKIESKVEGGIYAEVGNAGNRAEAAAYAVRKQLNESTAVG